MKPQQTPPPVPKRLVVSTYRNLLKLAIRFDLDPALRTLICVSPSTVYSGELQCWRRLSRSKEVSPAEQYLEDCLRFANSTSDFYLADPESIVSRKDWKNAFLQMYPPKGHRFSLSSTSPEKEQEGESTTKEGKEGEEELKFQYYPLSYIARLHFRGGPELSQFKQQMSKLSKDSFLSQRSYSSSSSRATGAASGSEKKSAGVGREEQEADFRKLTSFKDPASASQQQQQQQQNHQAAPEDVQPSAAQLGSAFHCVRWMRNLLTVVKPEHEGLLGKINAAKIFGEDNSSNDKGKLKLIPCYRAPLRKRWRLTAGDAPVIYNRMSSATKSSSSSPPPSTSATSDPLAGEEFVVENPSPKKLVEETTATETTSSSETEKPAEEKGQEKEAPTAKKEGEGEENLQREEQEETFMGGWRKKAKNLLTGRYIEKAAREQQEAEKSLGEWCDVPTRVTGHANSAFFLCAHPVMPGFFLGNILLMHHLDPENGALGFTINRPLRNNDGIPVPVWAVFSPEQAAHAPSTSSSSSSRSAAENEEEDEDENEGDDATTSSSSSSSSSSSILLKHLEDNRIFVGGPVSVSPHHSAYGMSDSSRSRAYAHPQARSPSSSSSSSSSSFSSSSSSSPSSGKPRSKEDLERQQKAAAKEAREAQAREAAASSQREQAFLNVAHFLHRIPDVPFSHPVAPGIFWGGDQAVIGQKLEAGEACAQDVMVLIGHAGWAPQQLEGELCNGSWISAVSSSPVDDEIFEAHNGSHSTTRPFASPSSASASSSTATAAAETVAATETKSEGETEEKKEDNTNNKQQKPLPSKFDTVADFVFSGNVPVSKEERLLDCKNAPDPLSHSWIQFIQRLGTPSLTRLAELTPEGSWMNTSSSSSSSSSGKK